MAYFSHGCSYHRHSCIYNNQHSSTHPAASPLRSSRPSRSPYYNNSSDELTVWINCTPSDNNMYLSRITIPNTDYETVHHEPLHENGTVIQIVLADYSMYVGTPFPGLEIQLDLYFSDVNTNVEVAKVEVHVKYPG